MSSSEEEPQNLICFSSEGSEDSDFTEKELEDSDFTEKELEDSDFTEEESEDSDFTEEEHKFGKESNERNKAKIEDEQCHFKRPCLRDLQNALVDSTKDNTVIYSLLSGITAAVGLATNSPATVIGSMLLSPIGDLIVRLSLVSNFKIQQKRGKTNDQNFSRKAFQERFLERLNIPTKKLIMRTKEDILTLWLRTKYSDNNREFNNSIKEIYKYNGILYFNLTDGNDNKLYDINGNHKYTINNENKLQKFDSVEIEKGNPYKISMKTLRKKIKEYENQHWIPHKKGEQPKKYDITTILWVSGWVCIIAILVGLICGLVFYHIQKTQDNPSFILPTAEMESRAKIENAWGMFFIAGVAGFILPWAIRRKNTIKLVGINIATALLPPLVNVGLYLGIKIIRHVENNKKTLTPEEKKKEEEEGKLLDEAWKTGLIIFAINFGLLFLISTLSLYFFCEGQKNGIFRDFDLC